MSGRSFQLVVGVSVILGACGDPASPGPGRAINDFDPSTCELDLSLLADGGVPRDGIPALSDPPFVTPDHPDASYVSADDRVVGLVIDEEVIAVPHRILYHHEIVNLNRSGRQLAVTYCPLTGSALVFDRASVGGDEFGVSGLLYQNNLLMYNRSTNESLWPQMWGQARCGANVGRTLARVPALESTWAGWRSLHPNTTVVSAAANLSRDYRTNPYEGYEDLHSAYSFPMSLDDRRAPKERVLGLPGSGTSAMAFPFLALRGLGRHVVVPVEVAGEDLVVFYDASLQAANVFYATQDGISRTFEARSTGIYDVETGTRWRVNGQATNGDLAGLTLQPVKDAYVAFWGAWAAFFPEGTLWEPAG